MDEKKLFTRNCIFSIHNMVRYTRHQNSQICRVSVNYLLPVSLIWKAHLFSPYDLGTCHLLYLRRSIYLLRTHNIKAYLEYFLTKIKVLLCITYRRSRNSKIIFLHLNEVIMNTLSSLCIERFSDENAIKLFFQKLLTSGHICESKNHWDHQDACNLFSSPPGHVCYGYHFSVSIYFLCLKNL